MADKAVDGREGLLWIVPGVAGDGEIDANVAGRANDVGSTCEEMPFLT